VPGLFEPDTLLPGQYFDRLRQRDGQSGEWRLMVAILEDAVNVYLKQAGAQEGPNRQLFDEAEQWIEAEDATYIFSFESICDIVGLDLAYLRRGLRAAKQRARQAPDARRPSLAIAVDQDDGENDGGMRRASGE